MQELSFPPVRRRIYHYLVDALGPNSGICVSRIPERLLPEGYDLTRQAVGKHAAYLVKHNIICKIDEDANPVLYYRGPNASILDTLISEDEKRATATDCNQINGRSVNVQNRPQPNLNLVNPPVDTPGGEALTAYVIEAETHTCGRYIFDVTKVGELYESFRVRNPDTGEISKVTVWEEEPKQLRGVQYYQGHVPIHGGVNVQYYEGATVRSMHIFPRRVRLLPGVDDEAELAGVAQDVANWLGRYGGWAMGFSRFVPHEEEDAGFHRAITDPAILANIPPDYQPPADSGFYIDDSPVKGTLEAKGPGSKEKADAIVNTLGITNALKADQAKLADDVAAVAQDLQGVQQDTEDRYDNLDHRVDRLLTITEKMETVTRRITESVSALAEARAIDLLDPLDQATEVMFG